MTAPVKVAARPLSPHLQVYRLPLAAILSILHRITGIGLTLGTLLLTWWIAAAAYGPGAYRMATDFMASWPGLFIMFGFSAAAYFHLCNGIRHLFWDFGAGFEKPQYAMSNALVIVGTLALTFISWLFVFI